jgi:hypothetical protein
MRIPFNDLAAFEYPILKAFAAVLADASAFPVPCGR